MAVKNQYAIMATAADSKVTKKKATAKKTKTNKGGVRSGAGAYQLVPNKVRKTIDIPGDVAKIITTKAKSDVSGYMRKATYNQLVTDGLMTQKRADELTNWKKK